MFDRDDGDINIRKLRFCVTQTLLERKWRKLADIYCSVWGDRYLVVKHEPRHMLTSQQTEFKRFILESTVTRKVFLAIKSRGRPFLKKLGKNNNQVCTRITEY